MNSYIKNLQSKSENTRKQILLISLVTCMVLVVSIWIYDLGNHASEAKADTDSGTKPFTLFANSVSNAFKNLTASAGKTSTDVNVEDGKQIDLVVVEHPGNQ